MRTLLRVSMNVDLASKAIRDGSMQRTMQTLKDLIHPEASYFTADKGKRTGYFFFNLVDPSQIPVIAEPLFETLGAELDFLPVMNAEELAKGLKAWETKKAA